MASDHDELLNSTSAAILGFLHEGPMTGWQLVATVETSVGPFWSITRSQVYRELSTLAERGLVEQGSPGARDARPYALTGAGRTAFESWAEQGPGKANLRLPLLLFTTLGKHIGRDRMLDILRAERKVQAAQVRTLSAVRVTFESSGADPYSIATVDYGATMARASLRWIDRHLKAFAAIEVNGDRHE
jgi:DNA-binding PadR family transcriptional regulator